MASARSNVVFPALVAPAIMMFFRAATAAEEKPASSEDIEPFSTSMSRLARWMRARRMDSEGRWHTPITAERRLPSGRRSSSCGLAVSKGGLVMEGWAPSTWTSSTSSSSVSATGGNRFSSPLA